MSIKDESIAWVRDYFEKNGNAQTKAVIGISGGMFLLLILMAISQL